MRKILWCMLWFLVMHVDSWGQGALARVYFKKSYEQIDAFLLKQANKYEARNKSNELILIKMLMGENHERYGQLKKAEQFYVEAHQLASQTQVRGNGRLMNVATNKTIFDAADRLGFFYLSMGNIKQAEELFKQSNAARNAHYKSNSAFRAMSMIGLGSVAYRLKQYDKAYQFYTDVFKLLKSSPTTGYNFDTVTKLAYEDMVEICLVTNRLDDASKYLDLLSLAASTQPKLSPKMANHTDVARIMEIKARHQLALGNFSRAQQYLDRAKSFVPRDVVGSTLTFRLLFTQAKMHWIKADVPQASKSFVELVQAYRGYLANSFNALTEYEKEKFYYTLKDHLEHFNAFVLFCHQSGKAKELGLYEVLYDNQIYTKALLVSDINNRKNKILNSGNQTLIKALEEWENLRGQLSALYYQKNADQKITELEQRVEQLEKQLNQVAGESTKTLATWSSISQKLKMEEAAVEIIRVNNALIPSNLKTANSSVSYLFLVNTNKSLKSFDLSNGMELESRSVRFYRNAITKQIDDELSYDKFWRPIKQNLSGVKRVYFSTDGVFTQINLNTLKNPATGNYVLDETEVVYVTNTRDLLKEQSNQPVNVAYLFGRPAYAAEVDRATNSFRSLANQELTSLTEQTFADLPGTEEEINTAFSALNATSWNVKKYMGMEATEGNVKSVKNPRLLHIATHGFFIGDTTGTINPMIRSGLLFSGVSTKGSQDQDGILTAYEAALLNLQHTDLVILSACETGLGEVRNGEGVYGLQRAIMASGTKNLLMSLWKVDDQATNLLMGNFYQAWNSKTTGEAFREAQKMIRQKYPHPYYWGAFVMLGK